METRRCPVLRLTGNKRTFPLAFAHLVPVIISLLLFVTLTEQFPSLCQPLMDQSRCYGSELENVSELSIKPRRDM